MLVVVDFNEGDAHVVAAILLEVVRLGEAEKVVPEGDRSRQVGDKVTGVRDAGDSGAAGSCILRKRVQFRCRQKKSADSVDRTRGRLELPRLSIDGLD